MFGCISVLAAGSYWFYARIPGRAAEIHSAQRIALVVAISKYQHLPSMPNAVGLADRVADALQKRGFKVIERINLDRSAMIQAVTNFEPHSRSPVALGCSTTREAQHILMARTSCFR